MSNCSVQTSPRGMLLGDGMVRTYVRHRPGGAGLVGPAPRSASYCRGGRRHAATDRTIGSWSPSTACSTAMDLLAHTVLTHSPGPRGDTSGRGSFAESSAPRSTSTRCSSAPLRRHRRLLGVEPLRESYCAAKGGRSSRRRTQRGQARGQMTTGASTRLVDDTAAVVSYLYLRTTPIPPTDPRQRSPFRCRRDRADRDPGSLWVFCPQPRARPADRSRRCSRNWRESGPGDRHAQRFRRLASSPTSTGSPACTTTRYFHETLARRSRALNATTVARARRRRHGRLQVRSTDRIGHLAGDCRPRGTASSRCGGLSAVADVPCRDRAETSSP